MDSKYHSFFSTLNLVLLIFITELFLVSIKKKYQRMVYLILIKMELWMKKKWKYVY